MVVFLTVLCFRSCIAVAAKSCAVEGAVVTAESERMVLTYGVDVLTQVI